VASDDLRRWLPRFPSRHGRRALPCSSSPSRASAESGDSVRTIGGRVAGRSIRVAVSRWVPRSLCSCSPDQRAAPQGSARPDRVVAIVVR
jgi:hypothetical protein